jgi:cobalt-zinc-cadmium efflux system membrane fusion protein
MITPSRTILWAALAAVLFGAGCRDKSPAEPRPSGAVAAASVSLTAEAVRAADLKTATAASRPVARRIIAPGELEWNARRVVHLTARAAGRLERVLAVPGDRVQSGQLLAEIFSPEFLTRQAEYVQAAARLRRSAAQPAEADQARAVLAGARERLSLLGVPEQEIDALDTASAPRSLLAVRAPIGGTVLESGVVEGDTIEAGASLFRLADPSTLWGCLHVREEDLSGLKVGAAVVLKAHAYPDEEFPGRLVLVGDIVDAATRTVEGRVEIANAGLRLKAGMYVEGVVPAGERAALVVPEESVQDDEGRPIVFVRTGERTFVRRPVETGERFPGLVEVLKGLTEGETVVTSGSFLLKSELRKGSLGED